MLLRVGEIEVEWRRTSLGAGDGELRGLFDNFNQAAPDQRSQGGARNLERLQRVYRKLTARGGQSFDQGALIVVQFAFDRFQQRDLDRALGVLRGGDIFAAQPLFADHPIEDSAWNFGCRS